MMIPEAHSPAAGAQAGGPIAAPPSVATTMAMRAVMAGAAVLVLGIGAPLMALPAYTDVYFVWPVEPALTAGFLGANYLAAGVLAVSAARQRRWEDMRSIVPGVMVFTLATLALTLIEARSLDFRRPVVLAWTAVYAGYPVALGWAWWLQVRHPGRADAGPTEGRPAPRLLLGVLGGVLVLYSAALVFVPTLAGRHWAWELHPPGAYAGMVGTEAYIGAWLLGLGVVLQCSAREAGPARLRPVWMAGMALTLLQGAVLGRSIEELEWARPGLWAYTTGLVVIGVLSVCGYRASGTGAAPRAA